MKKRFFISVLIFIFCAGLIKSVDIARKYEINILDYISYSMSLTPEEQKYLDLHEIKYGFDVKDAPFSYVSFETNQNIGILIDYFNQLSVTLEDSFTGIPYDDFNLARKLKEGKVDTATLNITKYNRDVFLFTQPLYTERSKILVRNDSKFNQIKDVNGISIAVTAGTTAHHAANEYFQEDSQVKLVLAKNLEDSFYMFSMKEVDAILGDEAQISYHLNQAIRDNRFRFLHQSISEEEVAMAVNKDNEVLYSILNKGIFELKKNQQFAHIHSKWFGSFIPEIETLPSYENAADALIVILAVIFLLIFWNRTVYEQVNWKTKELKKSKREIRDILDSLMDGIVVTNNMNRIEVCNVTLSNLVNLSFQDMIGRNISDIDGLQPYLDHINEKAAFKHNDLYYLVSQRDFDVDLGKKLLIIEDYTERHRYETLTKQESKMIAIGELSAGFAHEIRNPLGLIRSYIYVLKKKKKESLAEHAFAVIDDSVDRINGLIENLLNFSRLSVENKVRVNYLAVINSILELEQKNLEKNDIKLKKIVGMDSEAEILLNKDIMQLVLINLINNSIDALKESERENKEITLSIDLELDSLRIDFTDNGMGIPEDKEGKVFNPFYTSKESGTGLGLYIVDSEIRSIGGHISLESKYGEGTTFHVILPVERGKHDEPEKKL